MTEPMTPERLVTIIRLSDDKGEFGQGGMAVVKELITEVKRLDTLRATERFGVERLDKALARVVEAEKAEEAAERERDRLQSEYTSLLNRANCETYRTAFQLTRYKAVAKAARGCKRCFPLYETLAALEDGEQPPRQMGDR